MNPQLQQLIGTYQEAVSSAVSLLRESGVALPVSNREWAISGARSGQLGADAKFHKHGYGCTVRAGNLVTDFDFGPNGEVDGFDAWRLFGFAEDRGLVLPWATHRELEALLLESEKSGDVVRLPGSTLYRVYAP